MEASLSWNGRVRQCCPFFLGVDRTCTYRSWYLHGLYLEVNFSVSHRLPLLTFTFIFRYLAAEHNITWPVLKNLRKPVRIRDTMVLPVTGGFSRLSFAPQPHNGLSIRIFARSTVIWGRRDHRRGGYGPAPVCWFLEIV